MNIIICDDNLLHLDYACSITQKSINTSNCQISCFHSAEELSNFIKKSKVIPHIVILDIELGDGSGIRLAEQISELFPLCQIIFLSSYPAYASDVYQTSHVWFVLKNRINEYLPQAIKKSVFALENNENPLSITIKQKHTYQKIYIDHIFFMERIVHQTRIFTVNAPILVRQSPDELLQGLPAGCFIRCHQSYWVNASKISAYANNEFHLLDGSVIPVSRTFKKEALAALQSSKTPV